MHAMQKKFWRLNAFPAANIIYPSHRGCLPPAPKKLFDTSSTVRYWSSYTYPDIVYAILNYTRLQQKNQITIAVFIKKHSFWILGRHPQESATDINYNGAHNYYFISHKSAC